MPHIAQARTYTTPVLMYHEIVEIGPATTANNYNFYVPPKLFEAELRYIASAGYKTMYMKDLAALVAAKKYVPRKTIVLTFDDGTEDFVETVLPLLQKYHLRATLYANPGFNGTNGRMNWDELKTVADSGIVEIAAHTMTHQKLTEILPDQARAEIDDSKKTLEYITGEAITSFAYPFGAQNKDIQKMAREAGFSSAVISEPRGKMQSSAMFILPRIRMGNENSITDFIKLLR